MSSPAPASVRSRLSLQGRGLAGAAVEKARLSVVPRRRSRAPRVPFVTLVSLLLLAGVVGLLLFNTSMQQASFTTTALEEQATNLAAREQSLEMDLQELRTSQSLAEAATALGMVPVCAPLFLDLDTGKVTGERATACAPVPITEPAPVRPGFLDPQPVIAPDTTVTDDGRPLAAGGQRGSGGRVTGSEPAGTGRTGTQQSQQAQLSQQSQQR